MKSQLTLKDIIKANINIYETPIHFTKDGQTYTRFYTKDKHFTTEEIRAVVTNVNQYGVYVTIK